MADAVRESLNQEEDFKGLACDNVNEHDASVSLVAQAAAVQEDDGQPPELGGLGEPGDELTPDLPTLETVAGTNDDAENSVILPVLVAPSEPEGGLDDPDQNTIENSIFPNCLTDGDDIGPDHSADPEAAEAEDDIAEDSFAVDELAEDDTKDIADESGADAAQVCAPDAEAETPSFGADPQSLSSEAYDVLRRWALLSATEKQAFHAISAELTDIVNKMDHSVGVLSGRFSSVVGAQSKQSDLISRIIERAQQLNGHSFEWSMGNLAEFLSQTMQETVESLLSISQQSVSVVYRLHDVGDNVEKAVDIISQVEQINKSSTLLALNAKIEAARAGEAGKGFSVVADEIKELSKTINQLSEDVREKITGIKAGVADSFESLNVIAGMDMNGTLIARGKIEESVQKMMEQNEEFEKLLVTSSELNEAVSNDVSDIVTMFQFHDRANQNITGIQNVLKDLSSQHDGLMEEAGIRWPDVVHSATDLREELIQLANPIRPKDLRARLAESMAVADHFQAEQQTNGAVTGADADPGDIDLFGDDDDEIELF